MKWSGVILQNVFNETLMNDAVYKFKRYEDASLSYTGIDKPAGEQVGLYSTVLSRVDYDTLSGNTGERAAADLHQNMVNIKNQKKTTGFKIYKTDSFFTFISSDYFIPAMQLVVRLRVLT